MSTILTSALFADVNEMMVTPPSEMVEKDDEVLEEEIAPPPPAALIDLDHNTKETKKKSYSNLALFVFNVAMFTTGMIVVKTIQGRNA